MCGRYFLHSDLNILTDLFGQLEGGLELYPRYNITPGQPVPIVREDARGRRHLAMVHWGLIPSWSKGPDSKYRMINARAETVADKPAYRNAYRYRRCLVPADGFYEWRASVKGGKQPYCILSADERPLAMAGIWEHWMSGDGSEIESCSILVTAANRVVSSVHDRMPVLIDPRDFDFWLDRHKQHPGDLQPCLSSTPSEGLRLYPVSTAVNNPRNDSPDLIFPLAEQP